MSEPSRVRVEFAPSGLVVWAERDRTVLEAARACGIAIPATCSGRGTCGTCGVRVLAGALAPPDEVELRGLARAPADVRLACRARLVEPVTVQPVYSAVGDSAGIEAPTGEIVLGIDLGTTSVACAAVDMRSGRLLGTISVPNRQQTWGADVLSRVAATTSDGIEALQRAAVQSIAEAAVAFTSQAAPVRAVIAGNTAMSAVLAGADVESLGSHPFATPAIPLTLDVPELTKALLTQDVRLVQPIAGFVGGDVTAGLMHTGMLDGGQPALLIDLGTNAEIALWDGAALHVTSAAAGPAFEGVGIECGGPAASGAVSRVTESAGTLDIEVLGGIEAVWLSGSGMVAAVAVLRRSGHLDQDGLMHVDGPYADRFGRGGDGIVRFALAEGVTISQTDVRAFQLAKAAVRVGIESVLAAATIRARDLGRIYVAGAFGAALGAADLEELGILPAGLSRRASWVGNASLAGAVECALDVRRLEEAAARVACARHVDLATQPGFSAGLMRAVTLAPFDI